MNKNDPLHPFSPLCGKRILLVATGCIGTTMLPSWISWVKTALPDAELKVVVTRSALHFTTKTAISAFLHEDAIIDEWDHDSDPSRHLDLAEWPEAVLVHPASMSFVSRLSAGLCDSPLLLALQGTTLTPIVVAASAPPRFVQGKVWATYQKQLEDRLNITLLQPASGISALKPELTGSPAVLFTEALETLAQAVESTAHSGGERRNKSKGGHRV